MGTDQAILDLINRENIGDQATLLENLAAIGHTLTQPTLSRHLQKLGVQKIQGIYRPVEAFSTGASTYTLALAPPNLIVLRTRPGHAQMLAVLLDATELEGTVGTLAGDDTVFIATSTPELDSVAERVRAVLDRQV